MNPILASILLQAAQGGQGGGLSGILMILAIFVIFYFFMIRPQSKKQKEIKKQREALSKGDKVVTAGGIHGRIREIKDKEGVMLIDIAPNTYITVDTASIYPEPVPAPAKNASKASKKEEAGPEKKD